MLSEFQQVVQVVATIVGISGGTIGLVKYFSDKRNNELREWQKVVLYKILRQNESKAVGFTSLLEKYRIEAQAFRDIDLKKTEVSEDALRRVLLELASSKIVTLETDDSFRLAVSVKKTDVHDLLENINRELVKLIGTNPFVYKLDEVVKEIAPKVGLEIPILRTELRRSIANGFLTADDSDRIAFPR
jgi:hypothetical protein